MAKRVLTFAVDGRAVAWQVMLPAGIVFAVFGSFVGAVAAASLWLLLALAHRMLLRVAFVGRHPSIGVFVTFAATAASMVLAGVVTGGEPSVALWFTCTAVVLLFTAVWALLDDYRRGIVDERMLQASLAATRAEGARRVQEQRDEVVGQVSEMLDEMLQDVDDTMGASGRLRELARERIRPLSHEMTKALPAYEPLRPATQLDAPWRTVAMNVFGAPVIRPLAMAVLVTVLFAWTTTTTVSGTPGGITTIHGQPIDAEGLSVTLDLGTTLWNLFLLALLFGATWLAGVAAVRWTSGLLPRLSLAGRLVTVALTVLLMTLAVGVMVEIAYIAPGATPGPEPIGERLLVGLPIFAVAFVLLLLRTVGELFTAVQRREADLSAELAWESARAHDTLVQERRFLATALHGPLQSTVAAAAMGLEEARRRGQDPAFAWEQVKAQLAAAVCALGDGPPAQRDLAAEITAMTATWAGLCDVEVSIDPNLESALATDWVSAGTVSDVITEATANAVMHGRATNVRIHVVENEGATMRIVVMNDGHAPEPDADQGLGSRQLDEVSISWLREAGADGTRLEIVLPAPR